MPSHATIRIVFFLTIITLPSVLLLFGPPRPTSGMEKRDMATRPAFRWHPVAWGAMVDDAESFFNDHFGFRDVLVRLHNYLTLKILGTSPVPKVAAGRDGWLYSTDFGALDDYRGLLHVSSFQADAWKEAFATRQAWLGERRVRYLFLAAPDKSAIYPEFVPAPRSRTGAPSRLDQLLERLEPAQRASLVDLRPALREAGNGVPLFYRTDIHWTQPGAFAGYTAVMEVLKGWYPRLTPLSAADLAAGEENRPGGNLAGMLGLSGVFRERAPTLAPKDLRSRPAPTDLFSVPPNRQHARRHPDRSLRAVVFQDSMGVYLETYLSEHFAEIVYIARDFDYRVLEEIFAVRAPDLVIEICHQSMLFGGLTPAGYHLHEGNRFASVGRFEAAVRQFHEAARLRPDRPDAHINLGAVLDRAGRPEEAAAVYRRGLERNRNNPDLLSSLGAVLVKLGRFDEARKHLFRALETAPDHIGALFNMGTASMRAGRYEDALKSYNRLAVLSPGNSDVYYALACVHALRNQPEKAVEQLRRAAAAGFDDWHLLQNDPDIAGIRSTPYVRMLLERRPPGGP